MKLKSLIAGVALLSSVSFAATQGAQFFSITREFNLELLKLRTQ